MTSKPTTFTPSSHDINTGHSGTLSVANGGTGQTSGYNKTNWDAAHTHVGSNGTSHTYINQDLRTTASPSFSAVTVGTGVTLSESTDRADLLEITSSTSGWAGLQIRSTANEGRWSFMTDGTTAGIYDDKNSDWQVQFSENGAVDLLHNGTTKLETTATGVSVLGAMAASGDVTGANINAGNWNIAYTHVAASDNPHGVTAAQANALADTHPASGVTTTRITNWDAAHTHVSSDGSQHGFIDQDVTSGSSPNFGTVTYDLLTGPATSSRDKLRVYSSNEYIIGFQNSFTFGGLSNDYAMTFQMNNNSSRGFW